jgi:hypothetical protein
VSTTVAMWGTSDADLWLIMMNPTTFAHFVGSGLATTCATCVSSAINYSDLWGTSSTNIYAVGEGGSVLHYNGTWSPVASGTTASLSSIWGTAANDIYAAGDHVLIHYDGASWSQLAPPPVGAFAHTLWGTSGRDLFIASPSGVYHFDGVHWSPVRTTLDTNIEVIAGTGDLTYMLDDTGLALRLVRSISWSAP